MTIIKKMNKNNINIIEAKEKKEIDKIDQNEIDKLIGIQQESVKFMNIKNSNNLYKHCEYCEKMHGTEFFVENMGYCIHCWAWLNTTDISLELGNYTGSHSFENIKKMIAKVYPIHLESSCQNKDCTFNNIKKYIDENKLHKNFMELLGFNKIEKKQEIVNVNINNKNRNLNINFKESFITI